MATLPTLPDKAWLLSRVRAGRAAWSSSVRPPREPVGPGQESVWDYPRPPRVEPVATRARVVFAGIDVADSTRTVRVLETAGAPVIVFPADDVADGVLVPNGRLSVCEWKGAAVYFDLVVGDRRSDSAAYSYPDPLDDLGCFYDSIAGGIAFYPGRVDEAWIGTTRVTPQPGGYYAGWVTPDLAGPIKGAPGTESW